MKLRQSAKPLFGLRSVVFFVFSVNEEKTPVNKAYLGQLNFSCAYPRHRRGVDRMRFSGSLRHFRHRAKKAIAVQGLPLTLFGQSDRFMTSRRGRGQVSGFGDVLSGAE